MEDLSRGTERRCADQLVTKLADRNPTPRTSRSCTLLPREEEETIAVNEVYRPLMRIDVNSLSVSLQRIISRLIITESRYEKIERKVSFSY